MVAFGQRLRRGGVDRQISDTGTDIRGDGHLVSFCLVWLRTIPDEQRIFSHVSGDGDDRVGLAGVCLVCVGIGVSKPDCLECMRIVVCALFLDLRLHLSGSFHALVGGMGIQLVPDETLFSDLHRPGVEWNKHGVFVAELCGVVGVCPVAFVRVAKIETEYGGQPLFALI